MYLGSTSSMFSSYVNIIAFWLKGSLQD